MWFQGPCSKHRFEGFLDDVSFTELEMYAMARVRFQE